MPEPTIAEILAEARRLETDAQLAMDARQPLTADVAIRLRNEFYLEHFSRLAEVAEAAVKASEVAEASLELNPSNYDHEQVCELNAAMVQVTLLLRAALRPEEGGTNG